MTDLSSRPKADGGNVMSSLRTSSPWQKAIGALGLAVLVVVGTQMADTATGTRGGGMDHGPGGNTPPPVNGTDEGEQTPPGGGGHTGPPAGMDH